jgi:hypothetical protein
VERRALAVPVPIDLKGLRVAGASMLGLGVGLQLLPHNPGLPCPLRTLTGVPCPVCGMTTAVKTALTGHVGASIAANPFGILAVLFAVLLLVRPRWRHTQIPVGVLLGCLALSWTWELHRFGFV